MLNTQYSQSFGTISIKEFAKSIGKPVSTVYSWKRNGDIPSNCFMQIGKCIFVRIKAMNDFMNGSLK